MTWVQHEHSIVHSLQAGQLVALYSKPALELNSLGQLTKWPFYIFYKQQSGRWRTATPPWNSLAMVRQRGERILMASTRGIRKLWISSSCSVLYLFSIDVVLQLSRYTSTYLNAHRKNRTVWSWRNAGRQGPVSFLGSGCWNARLSQWSPWSVHPGSHHAQRPTACRGSLGQPTARVQRMAFTSQSQKMPKAYPVVHKLCADKMLSFSSKMYASPEGGTL